ncbi:MAG: ShlB/FhaC/HecB family hemolysin secretion/activation protein [Negativicutes bacterium]|jgi:hemolysin activation/secretion protein
MHRKAWYQKPINICCLVTAVWLSQTPAEFCAASEGSVAGITIRNTQQQELRLPHRTEPDIKRPEEYRPPLQADTGAKLIVKGFYFSGQSIFSQAELLNVIADQQGQELGLSDLQNLAGQLTDYIRSQGYLVAQTYIPEQKVQDGIIEFAIIIGEYDQVLIRNNTEVSLAVLQNQLGPLKSGGYIKKCELERAVYLLGDVAGVDAKATLMPGRRTGTTDLLLDIRPRGKQLSGNFEINNYGSRFTGSNQVGLNITFNNPLQKGDVIAVRAIKSESGLDSGNIGYSLPLTGQGQKLGISFSRLNYELGEAFADINAHGQSDSFELSYETNFLRSRNNNLSGRLSYSRKKLRDVVDGIPDTNKKENIWSLNLTGDNTDRWLGGGANAYALSYSRGKLSTDDAGDAYTANTAGSFAKWNLTFLRQQYLGERLSLLTAFNGQLAEKNLDPGEKLSLGGAYGVRAYPAGEASGDQGYVLNTELRWHLPVNTRLFDSCQLAGFYDTGYVRLNKESWPGFTGENSRRLSGAGLGIYLNKANQYALRLSYAWKIGSEEALAASDKNGRFWIMGSSYF